MLNAGLFHSKGLIEISQLVNKKLPVLIGNKTGVWQNKQWIEIELDPTGPEKNAILAKIENDEEVIK